MVESQYSINLGVKMLTSPSIPGEQGFGKPESMPAAASIEELVKCGRLIQLGTFVDDDYPEATGVPGQEEWLDDLNAKYGTALVIGRPATGGGHANQPDVHGVFIDPVIKAEIDAE